MPLRWPFLIQMAKNSSEQVLQCIADIVDAYNISLYNAKKHYKFAGLCQQLSYFMHARGVGNHDQLFRDWKF